MADIQELCISASSIVFWTFCFR